MRVVAETDSRGGRHTVDQTGCSAQCTTDLTDADSALAVSRSVGASTEWHDALVAKSNVVARVLDGDRLECQIVSPRGERIMLTGSTTELEACLLGPDAFTSNRALVHNAWAFAKFTYLKVNLPSHEEQRAAGKRAEAHRELAEWITALVDDMTATTRRGWCSGCLADVDHQKVKRPIGHLPAYLCGNCGSPTLQCAGPGCDNMAVRDRGAIRIPRYCAEHRHEISGFAKADQKMDTLGDYEDFLNQ